MPVLAAEQIGIQTPPPLSKAALPGFHERRFFRPFLAKRMNLRRVAGGVLSFLLLFAMLACQARSRWDEYLSNGAKAYEQRRYSEAEQWLQDALREAERFRPNDSRLATTLDDLAEVYRAQGKFAEAAPLYERSMAIREKAVGPEHSDLVGTLNGLADLYRAQGKFAEAEPLYRRALTILEQKHGRGHPEVGASLESLADLYQAEGKFAEAEPLYRRSLAVWERVLGREHPHVATSLEKYALLLRSMNREAEAAAMETRAKAIRARLPRATPPK